MRETRLYTDQALAVGAEVALDAAAARHATAVLRLAVGAAIVLFNGDGRDYTGALSASNRAGVRVRITAAGSPEPAPPVAIRLALGISKGERMDFALQKAVELGVARLVPLDTARSVVKLDAERLARRTGHWAGVVVAACEQSGRRRLPELAAAVGLADWLDQWETDWGLGGGAGPEPERGPAPLGILLDPTAAHSLPALLAQRHPDGPPPGAPVTLLIGPEGGLTPAERAAARAAGLTGARLGPRILRTETAPLAAIAVLQALWGDLR